MGKEWEVIAIFFLIEMWKALQNGWNPPTEISKEYYYEVKKKQKELEITVKKKNILMRRLG